MNTKSLYGAAALAAIALASCSQEEVVSVRQDGIAYNVLAKNQTRAADSYCNEILPGSFVVWANADGAEYIKGDVVANENGVWTDQSGVRYWPDGSSLDFYAHVNGGDNFAFNAGAPTFNNFVVNDEVTKQLDLMYAVAVGKTRAMGPVNLNFRHALSQVCFKAENNTRNLDIKINSVAVGHLKNQGTYTFPTADTDKNYEHPDHNDNPGSADLNQGTWALVDGNHQYVANVNGGVVALAAGQKGNLTCPEGSADAPHVNGFANVMTLMPQVQEAWTPSAGEYNGAYFKLNVVITDKDSNKEIYAGNTVVPVKIEWKQGVRYIYTFKFNEGGDGGWTDNPTNPDPVLAGISYDVTVDDFIPVDGDGNGTNMETGDENYKSTGVITLDYNYEGAPANKTSQIKTNLAAYSFTFGKEYSPAAREGFTFLGWNSDKNATEATYAEGQSASLEMKEGDANNFTFFAIWEENVVEPTYTVVYTDGVEGVEVFKDQVSEGLKAGETTPVFSGSTDRDGYQFMGWAPAIKETVAPDMANENGVITYTATWKKTYTFTLIYNDHNPSQTLQVEGMPNPSVVTVTTTDDSYDFTISEATPSVGNRTFSGWTLTENQSIDDKAYKAGETITATKENPTITVYAAWNINFTGGSTPGAGGGGW